MNTHDGRRPSRAGLDGAAWRRSSHSNNNGACVEIAVVEGVVAVRDSKDTVRPALVFSPLRWRAFLAAAAEGRPHRH
ncbi:DUF397 domain-containing protein [Streptomyces sp. NPDC046909]|uniref:DUF397 domain-containing protein n=1 Tax=Streptomyces sp. NPDC046909 TaxID=3155617 RepID=UPI0033FC3E7D